MPHIRRIHHIRQMQCTSKNDCETLIDLTDFMLYAFNIIDAFEYRSHFYFGVTDTIQTIFKVIYL